MEFYQSSQKGLVMLKKFALFIFVGLSCPNLLVADDIKNNCIQDLPKRSKSNQQSEVEFFLMIHSERLAGTPRALLTEQQIKLMEQFKTKLRKDLFSHIDKTHSLQGKLDVLLHGQSKAINLMSCVMYSCDRENEAKAQLARVKNGSAKLMCDRCRRR
jgi:hypothetical protein